MSRRVFAMVVALLLCAGAGVAAQTELPKGSAPPALELGHFPDRVHMFAWRNWPFVEVDRLAAVLGTSVENVNDIARSMGLPPSRPIAPEYRSRCYITVLRRNWHLLPYDQLLTLLDMSAEELELALREDDFLFIKLGSLKPQCETLRYVAPNEETRKRAAEIRSIVRETFGNDFHRPADPPFAFVQRLSEPDASFQRNTDEGESRLALRYIYSYFGLYGDPLMDSESDPYPDGLLQRLAELGVNGIWLHTVLRQLAPSDIFPEFGAGHEVRLKNLNRLVRRAKRYGIGVYLYTNEPRAMPEAFFADRPEMRGVREGDYFALCTSNAGVRKWLADSLAYVFENAPDLAGVFTITASENLTNCASHGRHNDCPQCKDRTPAAIIAEVNTAIETGVHRGNPNARVLVWDWGWNAAWVQDIIAALPKSVWLQSVSEWSKPIERGGVKTAVGEYSISVVGPGPRATKHWAMAKEAGLKTSAKVQMNCTWEMSAVPYLPVLDLVAEHCANLAKADVDGMMLSWTLGGYPSPNLEIAQRFSRRPAPTREEVLDDLASERYGTDGAPYARKAWTAFSEAFREHPFDGGVVYRCPVQFGPSNLLYVKPTGYRATMIGFPYDDVDGWRGPYPAEVFAGQFEKMAEGWRAGLGALERAVEMAPDDRRDEARSELRFARATVLHFQSVANQVRFTLARNRMLDQGNPLSAAERKRTIDAIAQICTDEIEIARALYKLVNEDSRIGFEASNQYYYRPIDLAEKVINCRYLLDHWLPDLRE